jgi:hypothetical protein
MKLTIILILSLKKYHTHMPKIKNITKRHMIFSRVSVTGTEDNFNNDKFYSLPYLVEFSLD